MSATGVLGPAMEGTSEPVLDASSRVSPGLEGERAAGLGSENGLSLSFFFFFSVPGHQPGE